ncbi:MAG TPA: hypothetical protein VF746_09670 [Longimicrobium sp.]
MRRILPILALVAVSACRPPSARAQTPVAQEDAIEVLGRMREAYGAGAHPELLRHLQTLDRLTSNHPLLIYELARAYALTGDTVRALATLERLAPMGLGVPVMRDTAFTALRGSAAFRGLADRLAANAAPLVRSDTALALGDPDLLPESIAYDPVERAWYLGSLAHHEVVRVAPDGSVRDFAAMEEKGRVIGIKVDAPRRRLWVLETTWDTAAPRTYGGTGGWTSLRGYDLRTGREVARHAPPDRGAHLFNDLAVSSRGDLYVTDVHGNAVWRLRAGADALEPLARGPRFHWGNGIALSPDESRLYAAHLEGISVVDPRTGRMEPLRHPPAVAMADVDGLYACPGSLVAVQRMAHFQQVTRFVLSPAGDSIVAAEVLERSHPAYVDPTTGVVVGDSLFYIANAQFRRLQDDLTLRPAERPHGTVVLRLPIGPGCR